MRKFCRRTVSPVCMMLCLLVVLPQQVLAIIVAIRRPYDDVNVAPVVLFVLRKCLAGLMIEFDDEYRAVNAVVKNAIHFYAASPREIGIAKMALHFRHFDLSVAGSEASDMNVDETEQEIVLCRR